MLPDDQDLYITATCGISSNRVTRDERVIFEEAAATPGDFLVAAYRHSGIAYPKFFKMDNLSRLGWLAAELLTQGQGLLEKYDPKRVGIVLSNASSSLDTDTRYYETTRDMASPALFVYTLPNIVMGEICIRQGFKGENAFFITEAFDADFMQRYVTGLMEEGNLDCCICGWVEILGAKYKTVLFLVEKSVLEVTHSQKFTTENIIKHYAL